TEYFNGHLLQGEPHDARARALGGVAGHAGLFSTAADLARLCRMLVNEGTLDGHRYLKSETVALMWEADPDGRTMRTLGWDLSSPFSRMLAPFFPMGSVGHTGFTGTAVWIDPASHAYLIVLTNRVHPNGGGAAGIRDLRVRIAATVGTALFAATPPSPSSPGAEAPAADLPAVARDAEGREPARVRHPGRGRALLHLPHDARLRDGGGGAGGDTRRRARPSESDHGQHRRGTGDGSRPPVVHGSPHDPRP